MILTEKLFRQATSPTYHCNMKQHRALNVPCKRGWRRRMIGQNFTEEQIDKFLDLRTKRGKKKSSDVVPVKKVVRTVSLASKRKQYSKYLKDEKWKKLRIRVLKRDEYTCKSCGLESLKELHVHHIRYIGDRPWDTPMKFLVTLCERCHKKHHRGN